MAFVFQLKNAGLVVLIGSTLSGCWVKKTACRGLHNQMPGTCNEFTESNEPEAAVQLGAPTSGEQPSDSYVTPSAPTTTTVTETSGTGFALTRSTPEQLSNNIALALN